MASSEPGSSGPGNINVKVKTMRQEVGSLSVDIAADVRAVFKASRAYLAEPASLWPGWMSTLAAQPSCANLASGFLTSEDSLQCCQAPVSSLKEQLAPLSSIPVPQQRLIFKGRVLRDDQKLNEAGVEAGNTLHLVERPPDAMQQDGPPLSGAQQGQIPIGAGGVPDLGQFLQGMLASLGAPMPGVVPPAGAASVGQPGAGANAPRVEPLNLLGAVDAYMQQLQEGGSEAVTPILVTSLAPRNIEGLRVLHGSLTAAIRRILEGVQLSPELQAMLQDATAHPDRLAAPEAAAASTGVGAPGAGSQPAAGHRPTIASDPALQARLAQQSYPYMPLALAALRELLRRTQQHLGDALSPALTRAVDRLGSINALDASNRQEIEARLRTLAGVLHGSAALLTELSRGTAATMHAVNGNTAALAANAASVLDPTTGPQPVFPRLLPRSNMPLDVLLPMGINIPLGINPLTGAVPPGMQQPGGMATAVSGAAAAASASAGMAGGDPNQDMGANAFAAFTQQLPGLFGGMPMQPGEAMPTSLPADGTAQVTVWPTATIETVQIELPPGAAGGMGGLAEMLSMFGGGAAAGMPMPVDGVPVPQQEQPSGPMAHQLASAVMRSLGPMVVTIANQVAENAARSAPAAGGPASAAAPGSAAGGAGAGAGGGRAEARTFNDAMSSAIARMADVLSANADRVQQELQQIERETTAGAPLGHVISGVVQRTLTTLAQGASQTPSAAGAAAAGPAPAASQPAGARTAAPALAPATLSQPSAAATAAATSAPAAGTSASTSGSSQQPRGLGGGLRPTLPAKRKTPPAAAATAGAAAVDGSAPSTSAAGTGEAAEASGSFGTPRQRLAPVQTSGEGRAGSSTPGSPGGDRRKSLTRTPTPGLLRLTESGRSTPRGDLHPLREFPDETLNSMAEAPGQRTAPSTTAAPAAQSRQAVASSSTTLPTRPAGTGGAAGAPDLSGLLQMLGGLSAPQPGRGAAAAGAPAAASTAGLAGTQQPSSMPLATSAPGGAGAAGDLSGLMQMMGGLLGGGPGASGAGTRGAGAVAGNGAAGGMGGLMQMAAQVASDPNMQPMLNNMASSLFGGGGAGGGAGGLGSLLSGLLGAPPPGSAAPNTLVASMDALDTELSASEAAAWKAMLEADEVAQASMGAQQPLSEVYQAGTPLKARSLMSVIGGEGGAEAGNAGNAQS